ncbi:hypothetical protein FCULG_00002597 [Fusarium culmorum]|uniref:Uncharacterized protein n=1 Tax=Fusarium culmorum TaxID=5516 RepID=A0A2T4GMN0_FUSCU|nr:hypothetical protein FCULG_00002597 [Fusarium culmorum]
MGSDGGGLSFWSTPSCQPHSINRIEPAEPLLQYAYPATASTTARSATSFTTSCSATGPGTTAPPPSPSPSSSSLSSSWSFYP